MCCIGRLKGSINLINGKLVSKNRCINLVSTRLDLRNVVNSLQIKGKEGCYLETHPRGGPRGRKTGSYIYIYKYLII